MNILFFKLINQLFKLYPSIEWFCIVLNFCLIISGILNLCNTIKQRYLKNKALINSNNLNNVEKIIPKSVNYHFTRQCNYNCGFCFHTSKTSFVLPLEEAKNGLLLLKQAGMEKLNFSGGEPFIKDKGKYLGELVKYGKQELQLPSVTIVSNGSLIKESWFKEYGEYLDIIAISCDSFDEETNKKIGRRQGTKSNHLMKLNRIHEWCIKYNVLFKINTVVNTYNFDEDMTENISLLNPIRWKVFQCLLLDGENVGKTALRNAQPFYINNEMFEKFLERHKHIKCLVPECNQKMKDSYLILDEYMRFLNCQNGSKEPSLSILDVGVEMALTQSGFDRNMFLKRGGIYKWSKPKEVHDW